MRDFGRSRLYNERNSDRPERVLSIRKADVRRCGRLDSITRGRRAAYLFISNRSHFAETAVLLLLGGK